VVLAAQPAEKAARDGLTIVVEALFAAAEAALLESSLEAAATALAGVRRADPASSRLTFLEAQLARARANTASSATGLRPEASPVDPAAGAAVATTGPTELDGFVAIASARSGVISCSILPATPRATMSRGPQR
jgi:hypothetical protein